MNNPSVPMLSGTATTEFFPGADDSLSPILQYELGQILEQYLERLEAGKAPTHEELIAQHPDLAEPLRRYLESLQVIYRATAELGVGSTASELSQPKVATELAGRVLGDYEIIREVGRGGMGVVYEARQISLGRSVAIKVLPFSAGLSQPHLLRFTLEAQATARLQHPHIVPVYTVGCDQGIHFYVMPLIDGAPLDAVIQSLKAARSTRRDSENSPALGSTTAVPETVKIPPGNSHSFFAWVARLGIEAAEGLLAAHEAGIIHRDIKPSNLLLDGTGKLWITDFGLARMSHDSTLSHAGAVIGTCRYMSPEQASGRSHDVDPRSDVYSLGATLYELLALRPAFDAPDREQLLTKILWSDPRPLRRLNSAVPRDLENVVLKALEREPHVRYATAREMADDLQRFVEGRPTLARPASLVDHAVKLCARHSRVTAATIIALLVFAVGAFVATMKLATEQKRTRSALDTSNANLLRAEHNLRRAREAVDQFGLGLLDQLEEVPGSEPIRNRILNATLDYYAEFIAQAAEDESLRAELGTAQNKAGQTAELLGLTDKAIAFYRSAATTFEQSAAAATDNSANSTRAKWREQQASSLGNLGLLLCERQDYEAARPALASANQLLSQLAAEQADEPRLQETLGRSWSNLGLLELKQQRSDAAEAAFARAIPLQQGLVERFSDEPKYRRNLAITYSQQAQLRLHARRDDATESARLAVELLEPLLSQTHDPRTLSDMATCYSNLGTVYLRTKNREAALTAFGRGVEVSYKLCEQSPLVAVFQRDLAVSLNQLGRLQADLKKLDDATATLEDAATIVERLLTEQPENPGLVALLGGTLNNLGLVHEKRGEAATALNYFEQAVRRLFKARLTAPHITQVQQQFQTSCDNFRRLWKQQGTEREPGWFVSMSKKT